MGDEPVESRDLVTLRTVAEAATPGPWRKSSPISIVADEGNICGVHDGGKSGTRCIADADYLATFDPPTVLKLLAVVEAAREVDRDIENGWGGVILDCLTHLSAALEAIHE